MTGAQVLKEGLVRLDRLPLLVRVPSLPDMPPETHVELEISQIDLLELTCDARYMRRMDT